MCTCTFYTCDCVYISRWGDFSASTCVYVCVCVCVCVCTLSMRLWTPCLPVKMIEEVEERFSEDEIQELLELVTMVLPDSSGQEAMETESLRTTNKEDGIGT